MLEVSWRNNLKWALEGGLKIQNFTCRNRRNFGPSLDNHNSVMRPFINMPSFVLLVLLTNIKYDEYQKKSCENVPLRGAQKPKNIAYYKNRFLHMHAHLSYWGNKCPFHLYLSLLALIYDLFRNSREVQRGNRSFRLAGGGGGKTSQNLCYLYNSIRYRCSHAS